MHPIPEERARQLIARTFQAAGVATELDRFVHVGRDERRVRLEVAAAGHKFGVAYLTDDDWQKAGDALPPHSTNGQLVLATGEGGTKIPLPVRRRLRRGRPDRGRAIGHYDRCRSPAREGREGLSPPRRGAVVEVTNSDPEKSARRALLVAGGASVLGVAIAGTVSRTAGGVFLVLGWLTFVYALHSFGRAGSA